jgi:ankyrin repeat protein
MMHELFLDDLSLWSCIWQSTLFALIGLVGSFFLRHRPARASQVLLLAMIAVVLVPAMSVAVKHFELGLFATESSTFRPESILEMPTVSQVSSADVSSKKVDIEPIESTLVETTSNDINIPWRVIMLRGWMIATLLLLGRLFVSIVNGVLLLQRTQSESVRQVEQAADSARARLGIARKLQVRISRDICSPVIWCWSPTPILVVSSDLDDAVDWVGVISHELAHWRRLDHVSGLIAELAVCILPWNPLVWLAKKLMVRFSEQACDDWVVAGGEPCEDYAQSLLNFKPQRQGAFVPAVVHSRKGVAYRVRRILKDNCCNPRAGVKWALVVSVVVTCLSVGIAFAQTRPARPQNETQVQAKPVTSLHEAAADGDLEQVKLLLAKGLDVDTRGEKGMTPLHLAAEEGHKNVVELLIAKGADINVVERNGAKPVWLAMANDHRDIVDLLIQKGAKVLPMKLAACFGDTDRVTKLIREGIDVNAKGANKGRMALHWAVARGHKDTAELLIKNGANVSGRANTLWTPLHVAASNAQKEMVELLMAHGADITAKSHNSYTPLHVAIWGESAKVVEMLIAKGADMNAEDKWGGTPLITAVEGDKVALAKLLIAGGADVNLRPTWSALHAAAYTGYVESAKLLVENGADVNAKTSGGGTPLHLAIMQNYKETATIVAIAELLLKNGAKLDVEDSDGRTAFWYAVHEGNHDLVDLLVSRGAKVSDFHLAAFKGDLIRVKRFLEQGTDIGTKDGQVGWTPLHWAACSDTTKVAEFLLAKGADVNAEEGADVNAEGQRGRNPLHLAVTNKKVEVAELLVSHGADIHAEARWWSTPLNIAVGNGDTAMVEMLAKNAGYTDAQRWIPLHVSVSTGDQDEVEKLLSQGVDVNVADDYSRYTALHWAAINGHKELVKMLIAKGANINAKGGVFGATPIQYAADGNHREVVDILIAKGADIHAGDERWGATALHYWAWGGQVDMMSFLLERGWDIVAKGSNGGTPLGLAVTNNQVEGARFLIDRGANVNVRRNQNTSYLHQAVQNANPQIVELLLDGGADVDVKTNNGKTPLDLAIEKGHAEIAKLLRKHGAKE